MTKPTDKIFIIVKTPTKQKRICKFFFIGKDTSLYICFYFRGKEYYYGYKKFPAGMESLTFNFTEGRKSTTCPKLSYHESGEVHFKIGDQKESIEKTKISSAKDWSGEQIVTIIAEGLDSFEDSKKDDGGLTISFTTKIKSLKFTVWQIGRVEAGTTIGQLRKRYNFGFVSGRTNPPRIVHFGVKINRQETISRDKLPGLTVITGWDKSATDVSKPSTLLYLQGKI